MNNYTKIVSACQELLLKFPEAAQTKQYIDNRLSKKAQETFQFGWFPTNKHLHILQELVGEDELANNNLIWDKYIDNRKERHSSLEEHNLVMPYKDTYGNDIALVGRTILSEEDRQLFNVSKYKNTAFDKGKYLFNLSNAKQSIIKQNLAYIVEGQIDCIKAIDKDIANVVALGSSNMTFDQIALISRYTDNLVLLLDNDEAGKQGTEKIIKNFGQYIKIKTGSLPMGYKDVDEFVGAGGDFSGIKIA